MIHHLLFMVIHFLKTHKYSIIESRKYSMISGISKDSQDSNSKSTKLVAVRNLGTLPWPHPWMGSVDLPSRRGAGARLRGQFNPTPVPSHLQGRKSGPPAVTPSACSDLTPSTPAPSASLKQCEPWVSLSLPWSPGEEKGNIYLPPDFVLFKCQQGRGGSHSYFSSTSDCPAECLPQHLFIWGGGECESGCPPRIPGQSGWLRGQQGFPYLGVASWAPLL